MDNITEKLHALFLKCKGISTDTRTIQEGSMFFALKGPNFDANQYANESLQKGAKYAIVDDAKYASNEHIVLVPDVLKSLQDLATFHRKTLKARIIGLTGSNGKTTTKELLMKVLAKKYQTVGTKGNLNNHIGVPLTLLSLTNGTEIGVIEMGANKVGDIAELCGFANPEFGLITNIGEAHTQGFGGIEGVIRGKSELFDHLRKNKGVPFINMEDLVLNNMSKRFDSPKKYPETDVRLLSADPLIHFQLGNIDVQTQLIGAYNFQNIAAAVCLGRYFGVDDQDIADAIADYHPTNQRSQIIDKGDLKIIMDAYNANPSSMKEALKTLLQMSGPKHVILGDMKELEDPKHTHRQLGTELKDMELENLYLVGPEMKAAADQVTKAQWFEHVELLATHLSAHPLKKGYILIKGSRSMRLEKVLEALI